MTRMLVNMPAVFMEGQYKRGVVQDGMDWRTILDVLRGDSLTAEQGAALLNGSGYLPAHRARWTAATAEPLMPKLRKLHKTVRGACIGEPKARSHAKTRPPTMPELEAKMIAYLKLQRADVPQKGPLLTSELFSAVADAAQAEGKTFQDAMQSIAPGTPLPALRQLQPRPNEVLRRALNVFAGEIAAHLTFGADGPTVVFTPLNPVAAMLLMMREQAAVRQQDWRKCAWCGEWFERTAPRQNTCPDRPCGNNLQMSRKRARKKERNA